MSLTALVGIAILVSTFLVIAFKLDEEHGILRFAFIMLSMGLLLFVPAAVLNSQEICEVVVNSSEDYYQYGDNFTSDHWDTYTVIPFADSPTFSPSDKQVFIFHKYTSYDYTNYCYNSSGVGVGLVKAVKYPYWLFIAYLVVYLFYRSALILGSTGGRKGLKKVFKGFK